MSKLKKSLTVNKIRKYFKNNKDVVVGKAGYGEGCPVFNYLRHKKFDVIHVDNVNISTQSREIRKVPKVVKKFIEKLDAKFGYREGVTGKQALKVLKKVTK